MWALVADLERAASRADWDLVVDDDGIHPVSRLLADSDALAASWRRHFSRPPTVLVQADNSWTTVLLTLVVGRLGGTVALINRNATRSDFLAACEDIRPDALVCDDGSLETWDPAAVGLAPTATAIDGWTLSVAPAARGAERWNGGVLIGLTSGSTGRAKGVVQSEAALRYAADQTIAAVGLKPGDPVAVIVPLSSTASFCFGVYLGLRLGSTLGLWREWNPAAIVAGMRARLVTWTMCVPTMALQLAGAATAPIPSLRAMTVGGGPMDQSVLADAEEALGTKILRVFGMSEVLGHTTPLPTDHPDLRLGRDGRPFPGTAVRAVDKTGRRVPPGERGRAEVRGPSVFLGYARDGSVQPPPLSDDGFFATGDIVIVHDDGFVTIAGREKDVIIRGGRNIDIVEVERAVAAHPDVSDVSVGPVPDPILGERIAALVVTSREDLDLGDVTRFLAEQGIAKTKWPEFLFRTEHLPLTQVGKISRPAVRAMLRDRHSAVTNG
jgi:acyl-CoA synthetase (AMP-forming)/AMP-acid ligase II